jgi:hypothetical protein
VRLVVVFSVEEISRKGRSRKRVEKGKWEGRVIRKNSICRLYHKKEMARTCGLWFTSLTTSSL